MTCAFDLTVNCDKLTFNKPFTYEREYVLYALSAAFELGRKLGSEVLSQNYKYCTFRGSWSLVLHEISLREEMYNSKATLRDNVFLKISKGAPIQADWPPDSTTTEVITPRCGLEIFWQFCAISLQQFLRRKFRNYFKARNNADVNLFIIVKMLPVECRHALRKQSGSIFSKLFTQTDEPNRKPKTKGFQLCTDCLTESYPTN